MSISVKKFTTDTDNISYHIEHFKEENVLKRENKFYHENDKETIMDSRRSLSL